MKELRPVTLRAPSASAEFCGWIGAQFSLLLRKNMRQTSDVETAPDFVLGRQFISTGIEIFSQETPALDGALKQWKDLGGKGRRGIVLELAPDAAILRSVADGPVPLVRAWRMAEHDVALNTPFDPATVHILFLKSEAGTPHNRFLLVKRAILDGMAEAARKQKQIISSIVFTNAGTRYEVRPEALSQFNQHALQKRFSSNYVFAALAASMLLAAAINLHLAVSSATSLVSAEIESRDSDLVGIRALLKKRDREINTIKAAYAARKDYVPFSQALETLTKAIPDGTYLTELTFRGKTLRVSGYSDSAPKLISLLSSNGILTDPRFVSPVIKIAERGLDQFTIELAVKTDG